MARNKRKNGHDETAAAAAAETNAEQTPMGDNSKVRDDQVREAAVDILQCEKELDAAKADYDAVTAPIRKRIKQARGKVKGIMSMEDFNVAYRLWKMENVVLTTGAIEAIRLAMRALGVGKQGDLFPDAPKELTTGYVAGRTGKPAESNPYMAGTPMFKEWLGEYNRGQAEIAAEMAPQA